jgi:predicted fused transcriptional regulator/phosphomethylpyrimidine kinase
MEILVPISLGELYDKISILVIKKERIKDSAKLENIQKELDILQDIAEKYDIDGKFHTALLDVNTRLWNVEDQLRTKEKNQETFGDFVQLARSVYKLNDLRSEIKREVNLKYGSNIIEEKQYTKYD